jgi:uncharacterized membrane protein HdeD (DUF308 family)
LNLFLRPKTKLIEEKTNMSEDAMALESKQAPWWLTLMGGILGVIIGLLLLSTPVKTTYGLVIGLGIYWVIGGIFTLVAMFIDHTGWGWKLFSGVLSILAGFIILRYPMISMVTVPQIFILLLGLQGIIVGIIGLVQAFKGAGWGAGILAVLSIVFGFILVVNYSAPGMVVSLMWLVAIFALVGGIVQIVRAFQQRTA